MYMHENILNIGGINMNKKNIFSTIVVFVVLLFSITIVTADDVSMSRHIPQSDIAAGNLVDVSIDVTINKEIVTLGLQEIVPLGWEIQASNSELFMYSASNNEWIWSDFSNNVPAGTITTIDYQLIVPETMHSGEYSITGNVRGIQLPEDGGNAILISVTGDSQISVSGLDNSASNAIESEDTDSKVSGFSSASNTPVPETSESITEIPEEAADSEDEDAKKSNVYESTETEEADSYSESTENKVGYNNIFAGSLLTFCLAGLFYSRKTRNR